MVGLVALFESTQDRDSGSLIGLVHHHHLEAAFEGLVSLEVFLVLIESGCTHGTEVASRKGRFEDIGSIHRARGLARTHKRVYLIYKEDDFACGVSDLGNDTFEALLEFALVLRTRNQGTHIEGVDLFFL